MRTNIFRVLAVSAMVAAGQLVLAAEKPEERAAAYAVRHDGGEPRSTETVRWKANALKVAESARKRPRTRFQTFEAFEDARKAWLDSTHGPRDYRGTEMFPLPPTAGNTELSRRIALAFVNTDPLPDERLATFRWLFEAADDPPWLTGWVGAIERIVRRDEQHWEVVVRVQPYLQRRAGGVLFTPAASVETWQYDMATGSLEFTSGTREGMAFLLVD